MILEQNFLLPPRFPFHSPSTLPTSPGLDSSLIPRWLPFCRCSLTSEELAFFPQSHHALVVVSRYACACVYVPLGVCVSICGMRVYLWVHVFVCAKCLSEYMWMCVCQSECGMCGCLCLCMSVCAQWTLAIVFLYVSEYICECVCVKYVFVYPASVTMCVHLTMCMWLCECVWGCLPGQLCTCNYSPCRLRSVPWVVSLCWTVVDGPMRGGYCPVWSSISTDSLATPGVLLSFHAWVYPLQNPSREHHHRTLSCR